MAMRPEGSLWRELWEGCPGFKKGIMRVKESLSASGLMSIIGFRIWNPKIWHLDILYILSERSLRQGKKQEAHPDLFLLSPFFSEMSQNTHVNGPLPMEERSILISKNKGRPRRTRITGFPPVYCYYLILLNLSYFWMTCPHFIKPSVQFSCLILWIFTSLLGPPYHSKLIFKNMYAFLLLIWELWYFQSL